MKILFLDQTGKIAGAERVLLDIAQSYKESCVIGIFEDGPFRNVLENDGIPVEILGSSSLSFKRESSPLQSLASIPQVLTLVARSYALAREKDIIYVNTPKALVVGAITSYFAKIPLVYHLHDILTEQHFSRLNINLMVRLSNLFARKVIAVSHAAKDAFVRAGGNPDTIHVVYNGFDPDEFCGHSNQAQIIREQLDVENKFLVGHFSRLSPWKGQHIFIEAMRYCSDDVIALIVGDALFGEDEYAERLKQQVQELGLEDRVIFLGYRTDVPQLMAACDLTVLTSTAPEPLSRIMMETMLTGTPLIASKDGGVIEVLKDKKTGWLVPPGEAKPLADLINSLSGQPELLKHVSKNARQDASAHFSLKQARSNIDHILSSVL